MIATAFTSFVAAAACLPSFVSAHSHASKRSTSSNVVTFANDQAFLFDTDGNQIDAYATKINYFNTSSGPQYILYGISFAGPNTTGDGPLKSYSSVDLVNWKYNGILSDTVAGGRPHMIYNAATDKYVLWVNVDGGYKVGTSSSPTGGFEYVEGGGALYPGIQEAGLIGADHSVASFGDTAYLAFAALNFADPRAGSLWPPIFQTMHLSPLTSDFINSTLDAFNVTSPAFDGVDQQTESPDIFIRNGTMYIVTSNTCGYCDGSIGVVYRAATPGTPNADTQWKRDIVSGYSCGGQVEGVLPLTDPTTGEVTYVWHSTTVPGGVRVGFSGHIFQPLQFNDDGSVQDLDCSPKKQWQVPYTPGVGAVATGKLTEATDASPRFANYHPVCDSDRIASLYQTWTNSKTGVLREVAINVAAGYNQADFQVNVFAFSNLSDLVAPSYKYKLLGSASFTPDNLTQVFGTATVTLNATVTAGDMLGFSISEAAAPGSFSFANFVPFCHLEYDMHSACEAGDSAQGQVLFEQASGQNSLRGLHGNLSPVTIRQGKGIKFFSTVE
ncbi:hypothetical protein Sste5346_008745 [Sporothrix stenoceras]|uniref:Arabinanase/levansucrase/invertase n=1 Tax=Sporothrix stenoceras TaxID=5173 RepID=A0ABR3YNR0_9PEZI